MVSFLTDTVVCGFSLYHILAYFLIYSCIGWCLEVIYAAATTGQLVNRGFLNGPVCPIYGFGMIIVLFALTPLQHSILLLYIGGVILPSALELVGGWALYKLYHTRWWDYSDFPFNIGGYICLEFCLLWGVGTLVVMRIDKKVIMSYIEKENVSKKYINLYKKYMFSNNFENDLIKNKESITKIQTNGNNLLDIDAKVINLLKNNTNTWVIKDNAIYFYSKSVMTEYNTLINSIF